MLRARPAILFVDDGRADGHDLIGLKTRLQEGLEFIAESLPGFRGSAAGRASVGGAVELLAKLDLADLAAEFAVGSSPNIFATAVKAVDRGCERVCRIQVHSAISTAVAGRVQVLARAFAKSCRVILPVDVPEKVFSHFPRGSRF
ncbi:MAG: hypothetical protein V2I43_12690 [Parvularcula sp.]|nr:hypothetical protein [Parvularcula sp.]